MTAFGIWTLYVILGVVWTVYYFNKKNIQSENVIGSMVIALIWPLHIIYNLLKNK